MSQLFNISHLSVDAHCLCALFVDNCYQAGEQRIDDKVLAIFLMMSDLQMFIRATVD